MKSAVVRPACTIVASLAAGICSANPLPPIEIDGWRFVKGPYDLYLYVCDRSDCVRGSRVICYFSPPKSAIAPGLFRRQEEQVSEMLGEPSKTFSPRALDFKTGRTRSIVTASDGSKVYYVSGDVDDTEWHAWLSSSSSDAKMSEQNLDAFESSLQRAKN